MIGYEHVDGNVKLPIGHSDEDEDANEDEDEDKGGKIVCLWLANVNFPQGPRSSVAEFLVPSYLMLTLQL